MIDVTLADGSQRQVEDGATCLELAKSISKGLAQQAVLAVVNGKQVDIKSKLSDKAKVQILTKKDPEALFVLRHSTAHLMADAILRIFPDAQLTIGPAIDDGFYYDIYFPSESDQKITPESFPKIEQEMKKIVKKAFPFQRYEVEKDEANEHFSRYKAIDGGKNKFKTELVEEISNKGENLSFYKHGEFIDLCRGPHVPHTGWLKSFKLTKVSGAYWRADASRENLTRVYGTAFFDPKDLKDYLHFIEEAKKRDHRVLGEKLNLFSFFEETPGMPFFQPKGTILFNLLSDYMRQLLKKRKYFEVKTPLILSENLWHKSGHYANYMENMFFTKLKLEDPKTKGQVKDNVVEERPMAVKPMNCPGHLMIYGTRLHSHKEFPLRIAEMGLVHRRELSGVRHGLFRVQAFTQDDAHHFCTTDQIVGEVCMLIDFFKEVYESFDLGNVQVELSTRPEKSIGSLEIWEVAENALKEALEKAGMSFKVNPGDGAFYGPKIDFHILDTLKRSWQCGTIQLDFSMPERFGLTYVGADGQKHTPVMIHRACYGSLERFLGIVIENYAGSFPLWLAPTQVIVLPISEKYQEYAKKIHTSLEDLDLRVDVNFRDDRIGYKVREASMQKIPFVLIVGEKELENSTVNVRSRDKGDLGEMNLERFIESLGSWKK